MNRDEAYEMEEILNDLSKYQYPNIKVSVNRIREIVQPMIENEKNKEFKHIRKLKWSWNKFNPAVVAQRLTELTSVITMYEEAQKELDYYAKETQDILHALELEVLSDEEEKEIIKRLKEVRQYRRKAKDFMLTSEPLYKFAQNHKNTLKQIGPVQNEINVIMVKLENRTYTPREMTSLQEAFEKIKIN